MTRNVVLICLDSVRKDYFDRYTKRLASAADVSFEQCRAASSWSVPSHASMLTGTLPHQHGVHTHNLDFSTISTGETFLDLLTDYRTLGVSANGFASSDFGFDEHFDEFVDIDPINRFPEGIDIRQLDTSSKERLIRDFIRKVLEHDYPLKSIANAMLAQMNSTARDLPIKQPLDTGAKTVSEKAEALVATADSPFFLFMNYMDAHGPMYPIRQYDDEIYSAPRSWKSDVINTWDLNESNGLGGYETAVKTYRELYGASIEYLDRVVSSLVNRIDEMSSGRTTYIVTSDHGENLGFEDDRYLFSHVSSLTEGLLHVPLLVINPPDGYSPQQSELVSHADLGDLVVGIAQGKHSNISSDRIAAERIGIGSMNPDVDDKEFWDRLLRCAYRDSEKYIWDSQGNGRQEQMGTGIERRDVVESAPDWALELFEKCATKYKNEVTDQTNQAEVDERARERLKDLGYLN